MQSGRTAILFFANRPHKEALRKPLFPQHKAKVNVVFYQELQDHIYDRLTPLGIPVIHIDDKLQRGDTFAERITNAVDEVWSRGFDRIIILGNDCPELDLDAYQGAIDMLDEGHSCLVSTQRGGAGLIAMHKSQFNRAHWLELEWQTERTFDELFDCLASCKVLATNLTEINCLADAYVYAELHPNKDGVSMMLERILNPFQHFESLQFSELERQSDSSQKRRGPPFTC